jgi:hypothetical protein
MIPSTRLRQISSKDFALLGMNDVAYVKRVVVNDEPSYAIYTADGTQVAVLPDFEVAITTIRQNDLEPLSLH